MRISRNTLNKLGLFTLVFFSLIGFALIRYYYRVPLDDFFFGRGISWEFQLIYGAAYGIGASSIILLILKLNVFRPARDFFIGLLYNMDVRFSDILFISFCAGFGEEILFRGAIQPTLGIWPTAILFILLHGYLNPFNKSIFLYGIIMVLLSGGLGYLFEYQGIIAAITAHFFVDVVLFSGMKYFSRSWYGLPDNLKSGLFSEDFDDFEEEGLPEEGPGEEDEK